MIGLVEFNRTERNLEYLTKTMSLVYKFIK